MTHTSQDSTSTSAPASTPSPAQPKLTGELIRTNPGGYGFIKCGLTGVEYFVHIQNFPDRLAWVPGQHLRFERDPQSDPRKAPRAIHIELG